jgi:hypothetical protein
MAAAGSGCHLSSPTARVAAARFMSAGLRPLPSAQAQQSAWAALWIPALGTAKVTTMTGYRPQWVLVSDPTHPRASANTGLVAHRAGPDHSGQALCGALFGATAQLHRKNPCGCRYNCIECTDKANGVRERNRRIAAMKDRSSGQSDMPRGDDRDYLKERNRRGALAAEADRISRRGASDRSLRAVSGGLPTLGRRM